MMKPHDGDAWIKRVLDVPTNQEQEDLLCLTKIGSGLMLASFLWLL